MKPKLKRNKDQDQLSVAVDILAGEEGTKSGRFDLVAYTGAIVKRWYGRAVFDLAGMEIPEENLAILREHDVTKVVGHADAIQITDQVRMSGVVYDQGEGAEVRRSSKQGFPWKASVGLDISAWEEVEPDETAEVNGQTVTGPISIARKSRLFETSFVVKPADRGTSGEVMSQQQEGDVPSNKTTEELMAGPVFQERLAAAKAEGSKAARAELAEFLAGFPGRVGWAAQKFAEGLSAVETKAALADVLLEELATGQATKAKADDKAEVLSALKSEGVGVGFDGPGRQAGKAPTAAEQLAALPEAEQADHVWESSARLRAEFGSKKAFLGEVEREGLHNCMPQEV